MTRNATLKRDTKETSIEVALDLDDSSKESQISTGVHFFDHMLDQTRKHGRFFFFVLCRGDIQIDDHHTVEDVAISLGKVFKDALGDGKGIQRFGSATCPLDESLSRVVLDLSGRASSHVSLLMTNEKVGDLSTEMIPHFFNSFANAAQITIHVDQLKGSNHHHMAESTFKAFGLALRAAVTIIHNDMPSTKGLLY
eukprot:NODE_17_length_48642_cov_1.199349.p32 type:complete len:196 gc:universal NODE_17_length_48642_cov_1.199349:14882-14295(-)